jgi:hypothetical protein
MPWFTKRSLRTSKTIAAHIIGILLILVTAATAVVTTTAIQARSSTATHHALDPTSWHLTIVIVIGNAATRVLSPWSPHLSAGITTATLDFAVTAAAIPLIAFLFSIILVLVLILVLLPVGTLTTIPPPVTPLSRVHSIATALLTPTRGTTALASPPWVITLLLLLRVLVVAGVPASALLIILSIITRASALPTVAGVIVIAMI